MFTMTYQYRIYPSLEQEAMMVSWLETGRKVYNYALSERKDWLKSRKAQIDRCSLVSEYIIPSDAPCARLIQKIGRVHEQIKNARLDWQFKLAHRLCDRAEMIFAEDLDFRVMAKGFLGKHTLDAGLGQFLNQVLPWVCFKRGVYYSKVDASGTSQECPDYGAVVKKDLSVRVHQCAHCGSVKPRDIASGQVICARGLSGAEIASGWDLSGIEPTPQSRQDRVKEEAKGLCAEVNSAP